MPSLPNTMTAIEITEPGAPDVLQPGTRPVPAPGADEVLIKVAAAGVNRPDVSQRQGGYPPPPGASDIPGLEIAGDVVACGAAATRFKPGDLVCALVAGGGYAEYCTAPEGQCLPAPDGFTPLQAAALPETFFTVWTNVFQRGRFQKGESVLIHGGSSGIGTVAIQLVKAFGGRIFATAGNADKCRVCEELGAERAINYREEDFVDVVKAATGGQGVDLVLDMVGDDYIARNVEVLATEGRLVQIAFLRGPKVQRFSFLPVMIKRLTITGSTLRPRSVAEKTAIGAELEERVWPLLASGAVRPLIDSTFPLHEAAQAHARMESSAHVGKIMLQI